MLSQAPDRILVVDDEAELRNVLVSTLTRQGYEAVGSATGQDALALLQTETFDVLLSDLMMPGMDGLTLVQKSLELDPNMVVLIMTGQGTVQTAIEAMKGGAFDYLLKPFRMQALLPSLVRALEVRRLRLDNLQLRESVVLYELSQAIALTQDAQTIVEQTAEATLQQWEAGEVSVTLLLVTPAGDEWQIAAVRGENQPESVGQRLPLDQGVAGWVAGHHEAVVLNGAAPDPRFASLVPRPDLQALVSMPMLANNKLVGVLNVTALRRRRPFTPGRVKALSILANTAASAIANAQLHAQLREDEERFRALIEHSSEAVTLLNAAGQMIYDSPAELGLLGYGHNAILGQNVFDFVHPDDQGTARALFGQLLQEDNARLTATLRFRHKDGAWRWLEAVASNLLANPSVKAVVLNYRDVTERQQAEQQIRTQVARLTALREVDTAISASLDLRLTLNVLLDQVMAQLGVDAADVLLARAGGLLEYVAGRGFRSHAASRDQQRVGKGLAGRAAETRQVISLPDIAKGEFPSFVRDDVIEREGFRAYFAVPLFAKGKLSGVLEIFHRAPLPGDADWLGFLETLAGQAAIAIENAELFTRLQISNSHLILAYDATIEGWSRALDLRDKETEGHSARVTDLTIRLAQTMGIAGEDLAHIRRGALLHDIGKMGVPDHILLKPGPLTDDEWVSMRKHPGFAFEMLSPIAYLRPALDIPYCHHEMWDGTGYPRGLKGEAIPLAARLFAVVDVWDALCSDRPYRPGWPPAKVREHIRSLAGTHFDPQVVEPFLTMISLD